MKKKNKAEHQRIDAFELWCWRRLLRVPWTARWSNQSILKEISPGCSLEGLMLKLKLHSFVTWCKELTHLKRPWCWERLKTGEEGDDRGWDIWMASLIRWTWVWVASRSWWWTWRSVCCSPWDRKESNTTERLNWTELNWIMFKCIIQWYKYIYIIIKQQHYSSLELFSCWKTDNLYSLKSNSPFPCPSSPWPLLFYSLWVWLLQTACISGITQHWSFCVLFHLLWCTPVSSML